MVHSEYEKSYRAKLSCGLRVNPDHGVYVFSSSQLLQSHSGADRMVVLLSIYEEEDEAYQDLATVATTFFQYLLQPFRDMRELACLYKMDILVNTHVVRMLYMITCRGCT